MEMPINYEQIKRCEQNVFFNYKYNFLVQDAKHIKKDVDNMVAFSKKNKKDVGDIVRKKIVKMLLFATVFFSYSECLAQPNQEWIGTYSGTANQLDYGRAIQIDGSGNSYLAGTVSNTGTAKDIAVIKYNSLGVQQWVATYNGTANSDDWAYCLAVDSLGNTYAAGFTNTASSGKDFITVKFDSSGVLLWARQYNGPGNLDDAANHITIDRWNNVAVTGISKGSTTGDDYATVKYDSLGTQQWVARYDGTASSVDDARTITSDKNGNVYVSGGSIGTGSDYDYLTIKYDSAGTQQWAARYNGPNNGYDLVYYQGSVVVDKLGNVYITGYSTGLDSTLDYATIKYDSNGNQLWVSRFYTEVGKTDYADAIHVDDSMNVYVTGGSYKTGNDYEFATIKYDTSGMQQWVSYYNGTGNSWDEAYGVLTDDSLNVYIVGRSPGPTTSADYVIIKYSPSGNQMWEVRYVHNGYDWPFNIRMSSDKSIFIGGWTSPPSGMADMTIIKYSQTPLGIESYSNVKNIFNVFPNPSNGEFTLVSKNERKEFHIEIYDLMGQIIFQTTLNTEEKTFKLDLPNGIYSIRFTMDEISSCKKIIISQ